MFVILVRSCHQGRNEGRSEGIQQGDPQYATRARFSLSIRPIQGIYVRTVQISLTHRITVREMGQSSSSFTTSSSPSHAAAAACGGSVGGSGGGGDRWVVSIPLPQRLLRAPMEGD